MTSFTEHYREAAHPLDWSGLPLWDLWAGWRGANLGSWGWTRGPCRNGVRCTPGSLARRWPHSDAENWEGKGCYGGDAPSMSTSRRRHGGFPTRPPASR
jgi:hypothetical protein